MKCPKCDGENVFVRTETSEKTKLHIGFFWVRKETTGETKETCRCTDCEYKWEGGQ